MQLSASVLMARLSLCAARGAVAVAVPAVLCGAAPLLAQVSGSVPTSPSLPPALPSSSTGASTSVVVDPNRVYGDDSPAFSPFAILGGFGVDITASMATEFDDNVARADDDRPLRFGLVSRSDFIFRPDVAVAVNRGIGRQSLFLNANLGKAYHARNTLLDRENIGIGGGLAWRLGTRCAGTLQGGWRQRGAQYASFIDVIPTTNTSARFSVSASCPTAGGLTPNISYDYSDTRNETDPEFVNAIDRSFSNVRSQGINGGLSYRLSTRGEIGVQGQWRDSVFPNQFLPTGEENGSKITGANAFANYRLSSSLSVNGSIGFSKVKPKAPLAEAFSGSVWNLGMNYSGPKLGAQLSAGRSVNGSGGGFANYSISKFFSGSVSYRASSRLSADAGVSISNNDMRGIAVIPVTNAIRDMKTNRYFIGADYRMNRILAFSLDLRHQNRTTDPDDFGFKSNTITLSARANF